MLKQNQIIKDRNGNTRKVLGVCGEVIFLSKINKYDTADLGYTEKDLKVLGYTWEEKWEPNESMRYYYIDMTGRIDSSIWQKDEIDIAIKSFLGVYKDKSSAEEALKEIKRKLGI